MYTETRNNFSIRTVILQFLFIALFVFILIWLFPMKKDLKKAVSSSNTNASSKEDTQLSILYDRIFNENLLNMKEFAKDYFTTSRLPKKVGESEKITLQQMLDKKIILPFTDKNGKQCDTKASYVIVTKNADEFVMKINLKCGSEENYLVVNMGCYDYCSQTICEKKNTTSTKVYTANKTTKPVKKVTVNKTTKPVKKVTTTTTTTQKTKVETKTEIKVDIITNTVVNPIVIPQPEYRNLYEYKKVTTGNTTYTDWSDWSTTVVTPNENTEVKYKKTEVKKLIAYKKTTSDDLTKPIYSTINVPIASKNVTTCASYDITDTTTVSGYNETYVGTIKTTSAPTATATTRYEYVGTYNWYCDGECTSGTVYLYKMYQRTPISTTNRSYTCTKYNTSSTAILGERKLITGYEKKVTTEPVYETSYKTYYSYRTKVTTPGQVILKWSVYNDTTLLNDGYSYTGNVKTEIVSK